MSTTFTTEQITRIRDGVRRLEERAVGHEEQLEVLVAMAETDVRQATIALAQHDRSTLGDAGASNSRQSGDDHCVLALDAQLRRSEDGLKHARRLCVAAREAHLATSRVVVDLRAGGGGQKRSRTHAPRHAVLVVDDHDDSRDLLSMVLLDAGFLVRTATNGLEAVLAAYEMRPAVIVMDMTMPVLDGVEATRLIKAIDALREARVIAYSARPELDDKDRTLFAAVLTKPAPHDVVIATVQRYVTA